jgi:hypothetical protein
MNKLSIIVCMMNLLRNTKGSYILYPQNVDFSNAVITCDLINGTVVFPKNQTEDDIFINYFLNNNSVRGIWLAINDFIGNEIYVYYYTKHNI